MQFEIEKLVKLVVILIASFLILKKLLKFYLKYNKDKRTKSYPKNVVILHQFPHNKNQPSISVPCLKIETWLRVSEIEYKNEYSYIDRSIQGQLPYITLNNKEYHDSQFIIEHLSKLYEKPFTEQLNKTDRAIARGFFKLLEESLKWTIYFHRFTLGKAQDIGMPSILFQYMKPKLKKAINIQGYGRHTADEIMHIGKQDLEAFEDFLANKKYLFGDIMSNEDILLFCFMAQIVYYDKGKLNEYLRQNCPSLIKHFKMFKNTYWSEWPDVL